MIAANSVSSGVEPDRDGDASCPLHEAAALITDNAGQRLLWAARAGLLTGQACCTCMVPW
ncbi:hypothetical protein OG729_00935 [Streptomyces sp. NBC_00210]|uniref:hypothetical protein n=1 Tax=unclassified Streptomyces TaxID=2593676 RepID=UPI0032529DCB